MPTRLTAQISQSPPERRRRRPSLAIAVALAGLAVSTAASANLYVGSVDVYDNVTTPIHGGGTTDAPAFYTVGGGNLTAVSETTNATGGTAMARVSAHDGLAGASTLFRYGITLLGPDGPPIGVNVLAHGFVDGSGLDPGAGAPLYQATASFLLRTDTLVFGRVSNVGGAAQQSFAINTVAFFRPNVEYVIDLIAEAHAVAPHGAPVTGTAWAFVDPSFIIDPAYASIYHLVGVPIEATGGVPEPSTWAMMILGLGFAGAALRRRRRMLVEA